MGSFITWSETISAIVMKNSLKPLFSEGGVFINFIFNIRFIINLIFNIIFIFYFISIIRFCLGIVTNGFFHNMIWNYISHCNEKLFETIIFILFIIRFISHYEKLFNFSLRKQSTNVEGRVFNSKEYFHHFYHHIF